MPVILLLCHSLHHCHYSLQSKCHQQNQIHIGNFLKILSIFLWNMCPAGAALNGSLVYLYLQNKQKKLFRSVISHHVLSCDKLNLHL